MKVGFCGLGLMGLPMASNLVRAGVELSVYNRSAAPRETLVALGARAFADPAELFAACDAVILMLANDAAAEAVLGRGTADFEERVAGKLIINMGTHAPAWSQALGADVAAAGGRFVEAPVSGSRGPAEAGELVIMVAGETDAVDAARPLLAPLCRDIVMTGAVPSAMACKMAVNLYLIASMAALAEAAALGTALKLDPAFLAQVIASGPLASTVANSKLAKMASGDFTPHASIRDVCKNAALVRDAATQAGLDAGLLTVAQARYEAVLSDGGGDLDAAAVITAFAKSGSR